MTQMTRTQPVRRTSPNKEAFPQTVPHFDQRPPHGTGGVIDSQKKTGSNTITSSHACRTCSDVFMNVAISCSSDANLPAFSWRPPESPAMAWLALESPEKTALAQSLGAVAKYPAPVFMLPKAKPKPRQPLRECPGIVAADTGKKRAVDENSPCTCTCKARRLLDAFTDLDKLLLRDAARQK